VSKETTEDLHTLEYQHRISVPWRRGGRLGVESNELIKSINQLIDDFSHGLYRIKGEIGGTYQKGVGGCRCGGRLKRKLGIVLP
jgi:hypothetical protein